MGFQFDYFVVLADMRTGSNLLEEHLNALPDVECHAEAFNPHFVGRPNADGLFGYDLAMRDRDPMALLGAIKTQSNGLGGFRLFHDHDQRVMDHCLKNPRCGKIILTRNPLESYISLQIARQTGQWKLTNVTRHKTGQIAFEMDQFDAYLDQYQAHQAHILNMLQRTGQVGFFINYSDLNDRDVINGMARFLGSAHKLARLPKKLKKQNPSPVYERVINATDMETGLAHLDTFGFSALPSLEPRRNPSVTSYVAAAKSPLLFRPIEGGPSTQIETWLAGCDGVDVQDLQRSFTRQNLRKWVQESPMHRSFTVVRDPLLRAYDGFCRHIFPVQDGPYAATRATLIRVHNLPLPAETDGLRPLDNFTEGHMRQAFLAYLGFLKTNLAGQTALRVNAIWASQTKVVEGFARFIPTDVIAREGHLEQDLRYIAAGAGVECPAIPAISDDHPIPLASFCDPVITDLARQVYAQDYINFGL